MTAPTLRQYWRTLSEELGALSAAPEQEAERWLCREYGWSRAQLFSRLQQPPPRPLPEQTWARRLSGEPEAYIHQHQGFFGLDLQVDPAVLIPRPDTETLVELVLDHATQVPATASVVDLGTGSGAIALALAQQQPRWQVLAVERCPQALATAQNNAKRLGLSVDWRLGSWFEPLAEQRAHIIASNPPYIAPNDPHLENLRHEPRQALVAADEGLADLAHIIAGAAHHLQPQGFLFLEHGSTQGPAVRQLLQQAGFDPVLSRTDLAGLERVSMGQWP